MNAASRTAVTQRRLAQIGLYAAAAIQDRAPETVLPEPTAVRPVQRPEQPVAPVEPVEPVEPAPAPPLALVPELEPVPAAPARHAVPSGGEARGDDSSLVLAAAPFVRGRHVRAPEVGTVRPPAAARFA